MSYAIRKNFNSSVFCSYIGIRNYDFELLLQCLIQNRLLYTLIINVISNTAAVLILDGYISDPVSYFIVTVIGSVIKYVLKNKLNERVDNYSLL